MPPVILGVAGAAAAAGLSAAIGGGVIATAIIGSLVSSAFALASQALLKPKTPKLGDDPVQQMIRQPITVRRRGYGRRKLSGVLVFIHARAGQVGESDTTDKDILHLVVAVCGHEIDAVEEFWLDEHQVTVDSEGFATDDWFAREGYIFASMWAHLGSTDQAADPILVAESEGKWTSEHRLRGVAYVHARLYHGPHELASKVFPTGIPSVRVVARLAKVYDPRMTGHDVSDSSTWEWSQNVALCVADYLRTPKQDGGFGARVESIDWSVVSSAADICDEDVALKAGGTEKRYTCNGTFDTDEEPVQILNKLLSAMAGTVVFTGGVWRIFAGQTLLTDKTLTVSNLRSDMRITTAFSRRDAANGVRGVFISPDHDYQPTDFPPIQNASYLAEDDGEELWLDLELPFTDSPATSQRLAKIELERARREVTIQYPGNLTCLAIAVHDGVGVTFDRPSEVDGSPEPYWTDKPFRVVGWSLSPDLGIDLDLKEEDDGVWSWDPDVDEKEMDPMPEPTLPVAPVSVADPTDFAATSLESQAVDLGDGSVLLPRIQLTWTPPTTLSLTGYVIRWRQQGSGDPWAWGNAPKDANSAFLTGTLVVGVSYEVELQAQGTNDRQSNWVTDTVLTQGDSSLPAAPSEFLASPGSVGSIDLSWVNPTDGDFRRIRLWRNTSDDFNTATELDSVYGTPGRAEAIRISGLYPASTHYFWAASVDYANNESGTVASSATVPGEAESAALVARMTTPPTAARAVIIDDLVATLKEEGIWSKLDSLYVRAAHDQQASRLNWIQDAYNLTDNGTMTFTADEGVAGDGTTGYAESGFNPTTASGQFVQDSASMFIWVAGGADSNSGAIGNTNSMILPRSVIGNLTVRPNAASTDSVAIGTSVGLSAWSRKTSGSWTLYRDGAIVKNDTDVSAAPSNENFSVGGRNLGGSRQFSTAQTAVAGWGASLTDAEQAALYDALDEYMTAIGA